MLLLRLSWPARVSGSTSPRRASRPIPDFVAADTMGILYACRLGKSNRNREPGTGSRRPGAGRAGWSTANPGVGGEGKTTGTVVPNSGDRHLRPGKQRRDSGASPLRRSVSKAAARAWICRASSDEATPMSTSAALAVCSGGVRRYPEICPYGHTTNEDMPLRAHYERRYALTGTLQTATGVRGVRRTGKARHGAQRRGQQHQLQFCDSL